MKKLFKKESNTIEINKKNQEAYETLYNIKKNSDKYIYKDNKTSKILKYATNILAYSCAFICFIVSTKIGSYDTILGTVLGFSTIVVVPSLILDVGYSVNKRQNISNFAIDYPEIDTNIKTKDLKESLNNIKEEKMENDYVDKETFRTSLIKKYTALRDEMKSIMDEKEEKQKVKSYSK